MKLGRAIALPGLLALATSSAGAPLSAQKTTPPVNIIIDQTGGVGAGQQAPADSNVAVGESITVTDDLTITPPAAVIVSDELAKLCADNPTDPQVHRWHESIATARRFHAGRSRQFNGRRSRSQASPQATVIESRLGALTIKSGNYLISSSGHTW